MPRKLVEEGNELHLLDNISGDILVLYYRLPSTRERVAYDNEMFQRRGRALDVRVGETRLKYGQAILTGIREGDFVLPADGREAAVASDPESEHFRADWKDLIVRYAGDLVGALGRIVFEESARQIPAALAGGLDGSGAADGDGDADGEDLEKN